MKKGQPGKDTDDEQPGETKNPHGWKFKLGGGPEKARNIHAGQRNEQEIN